MTRSDYLSTVKKNCSDFLLYPGLIIILLAILAGCKKETNLVNEETNQEQNTEAGLKANTGRPDFIVAAGGSIQAAVNAVPANSVIHIQPGTYNESITVSKSGITIMGLTDPSGAGVIINNPGDEEDGIMVTDAGDGFVLKNVTIQNFEENGVFLVRVDGFVLSHVTTINDGEYGLFPVLSTNGVIEHCTASGHTDTGIYVGQSTNVEMNFNTAFGNVNGLEIENCTNVSATKNHCYDNVCGILSVLLPGLRVKTSSNIVISQNQVHDNNHINFSEPGGFEYFVPVGSGILVVGTDNTLVQENKVRNNNFVGIAVVSTLAIGAITGLPPEAFADIEPNPDGARIINNNLFENGFAPPVGLPLPGVDLLWDGSGNGNCWKGNLFSTSYPAPLPVCTD
jgi:parallel beta-helix repeat protein